MHKINSAVRPKIAINTIPLLGRLTGVGRYIQELVLQFEKLSPQYEYLYYYGYFRKHVLTGGESMHALKDWLTKVPMLRAGLRGMRGTIAKYLPAKFDLYFEPNFIPLDIKAQAIVTTVHDFSFQLFPEAHPKDRIRYFRNHFLKNVRRSTRIITDSSYVKAEAVDFLRIPAEMITPIYLGVDHELFRGYPTELCESWRRESGLPQKFILFVGTREPRKNLGRLIEAYVELPERLQSEFSLVLVGPQGWGKSQLTDARKLRDRVVVLPYLGGHQLALTYNLASALVYPSLYEGFGLPPLEGMACGCPAVVSRVSCLPEICGDAVAFVDPNDVQSIAGGMYRILTDANLSRSLVAKGIERSKLFTWEKTAQRTLEVFDEVLRQAR